MGDFRLVLTETHPVQYHAPVYRGAGLEHGVNLTAVYGSDFSVAGYRDAEFGASFAWDTDLLGGVEHLFLQRVADGGAPNYEAVRALGLNQAITRLKPRALMALGYSHPFDREALRVARALKLPILFRGETSDHAHERGWLKRIVRDTMLRRLYAQCAALLYVGTHSRCHYERLGVPEQKLFASPYCVESAIFKTSPTDRAALRGAMRQRLGINDDTTVIMYSGKLSERKGVDLLPGAVQALGEGSRVHLLFVGDGALRPALERDCGASATFAGFQNQSALSGYYHAADLLVLPSRAKETWGLVVNEAMLHGLPCVVTDRVGCQPDLVLPGQTGAVCKADDAMALTTALREVIAMTHSEQVGERCRDLVSGYSVSVAASGIAKAWRAVSEA